MSFSKIIGHNKTISQLKEFIKKDSIPSSLIFHGIAGIGKFKTALEWAKAINCKPQSEGESLFTQIPAPQATGDACEKCPSCIQAEKKIHPDINIIDYNFQAAMREEEKEKQNSLKIETIREMIKFAATKPSLSSKKIFIINDADTMTIEAQNAILKLIEEPPQNNIIILIVSSKNKILPTILSRCQIINFQPLDTSSVEKILGNLQIEHKEALHIAKLSGGSVKKAIEFRKIIPLIKENIIPGELAPFLITAAMGKELYEMRENVRLLLELMINNIYYNKFLARNPSKDRDIILLIKKFLHYKKYIDRYVSPKYVAQLALIDYAKYFDMDSLCKYEN